MSWRIRLDRRCCQRGLLCGAAVLLLFAGTNARRAHSQTTAGQNTTTTTNQNSSTANGNGNQGSGTTQNNGAQNSGNAVPVNPPPGYTGTSQAAQSTTSINQTGAASNANTYVITPDPLTPFQLLVADSVGYQPPIFGADLFRQPPTTFAPLENTPVPADYVIGPGDTLQISTTGLYAVQASLPVDRTGNINFPSIGPISVAGVHFAQLRDYLTQQIGQYYRGFNLNVTLGSLRSIQVYVFGQARRPGLYTISSLSSLLNAVFASGGPLATGSLRDIQLKRDDRTVVHFDVYDLLLRGDKSKDVPLQPGDIIYIPPVGPQAALLGSVNVPAIYELRGETTLDELVQFGSGLNSTAAPTDVRIERIVGREVRSIVNVDLNTDGKLVLHDGDVVTIRAIVDRFRDAVTLRGNVANPGRYAWKPGMRLADLFPTRDALITRDYFRKRNMLGLPTVDYQPTEGRVAVSTAPTVNATTGQTTSTTTTTGTTVAAAPATNPGTASSTSGSGTTVGDALTQSNGSFSAQTQILLSAPDVDLAYAVIERLDPVTLETSLVPFNLGKLVNDHDPSQDLPLFPGDVVTIFSKADIRVPSMQQTRFVRLEGEFVGAGLYTVRPGERLRDLIVRAGGLTRQAYLYASEFTRQSTRRIQQQRLQEYADSLDSQITAQSNQQIANAVNPADASAAAVTASTARAAVAKLRNTPVTGRIVLKISPDAVGVDAIPDLELEDGDRFIVSRQPTTVTVAGQVYNASAFLYEPKLQVRNYVRDAGGADRYGDRSRMFVIRADGSVVSEQFHHVQKAAILPGDTVVVPPKVGARSLLRDIFTISSLAAPIASSLALIALVINQ